MQRQFVADAPNRLWCTDITEHPTGEGRSTAAPSSTSSAGRIVGWSIADHMRSELVVDALQMATWRRQPEPGAIVHADRGSQYTSWVFGHRLREAGLLGSMGRVASSVDNTMMESFWSTMQRELLDTRTLGDPGAAGVGDLRVDRGLLQPAPPAHQPRHARPARVRDPSHRRPHRGMITTPTVSGEPGQAPQCHPSSRFPSAE